MVIRGVAGDVVDICVVLEVLAESLCDTTNSGATTRETKPLKTLRLLKWIIIKFTNLGANYSNIFLTILAVFQT